MHAVVLYNLFSNTILELWSLKATLKLKCKCMGLKWVSQQHQRSKTEDAGQSCVALFKNTCTALLLGKEKLIFQTLL